MGLSESAAVGIVEKVMTFLAMPTFAMQAAVATMSSHNIGARQFARARRSLFSGICISLIIAAAATLLAVFAGSGLVGLFSRDEQVIRAGAMYIKSYSLDCMMMAVVFNFNGYLSSCNHSTFSMIHSLFATLCVRVPCVYLFSHMANVTLFTIGFAMPMSSFVSIILCVSYLIVITRREDPEKMVVTK
jgi:Na+-driven multidrug efflux pump